MGIPGRRKPASGTGFTLIELVLTVVLLLLLAGAAVFNFNSAQRGAQLEEGAGQVESLFRFARAQASSTGRRVQVRFQADGGPVLPAESSTNSVSAKPDLAPGIQVLWEPDPLTEPGKFVPLPEATALVEQLNELVRFEARPPDAFSAFTNGIAAVGGASEWEGTTKPTELVTAEPTAGITGTNGAPAPIVFYADGSSDSADFELVSVEPEDRRRVRLILAGLTGTVRRKWIAPENEFGGATEELPADGEQDFNGADPGGAGKATP